MSVQALEQARLSGGVAVDALVGEIGNWEGVEVMPEPRFGGPCSSSAAASSAICTTPASAARSPTSRSRGFTRDELIAAGALPHSACRTCWLADRAGSHGRRPDRRRGGLPPRLRAGPQGASTAGRLLTSDPRPAGIAAGVAPLRQHAPDPRFLLEREEGDIYNAPGATLSLRHYLGHRHEAVTGTPLFVHGPSATRSRSTPSAPLRAVTLDDDFEAIPIPGHTPGSTAYLWDTGQHRVLFTGDTIPRHGEWRAALLGSSDRRSYREACCSSSTSTCWCPGHGSGDPYHAVKLGTRADRRDHRAAPALAKTVTSISDPPQAAEQAALRPIRSSSAGVPDMIARACSVTTSTGQSHQAARSSRSTSSSS